MQKDSNSPRIPLESLGFQTSKTLPGQLPKLETVIMKDLPKKPRKGSETKFNLTSQEVANAVEVAWLTTCMINRLDNLHRTDLSRQDLKAASKLMLRTIEDFSARELWGRLDGSLIDESGNGSVLIDRLISIAYRVNMRERSEREAFALDLEAVLNKHNLSLVP